MRFMLRFSMPSEAGNDLIGGGGMGETMQQIMGELQPEAAYFCPVDGQRGGYLFLNIDNASDIPGKVEPLFLAMDAFIELIPVMTAEDLQQAMPGLEQTAQKYYQS